jgi:hypothetical protein
MKKNIIALLKNPWVTRTYLAALLISVLFLLLSQRGEFLKILGASEPALLLLAIIPYMSVVALINPYLHSVAYKEIGANISFWQAFRIFHLSRIGNYLPGRIWFASNYYIFSKKMNVNAGKIARNFIVLNALLFMTGGICSLPIINLFDPTMQNLMMVFPIFMLFLIHPKILNRLLSLIVAQKTAEDFKYGFLLKASVLYAIAYGLLGLGLYIAVSAYTLVSLSHLPLVIAAASCSLVIGLLAIFAPAGIGVSEGISTAVLSQIIPLEVAVMSVVSLRMLMVLVDFSCAIVSAVSVSREEKALALSSR